MKRLVPSLLALCSLALPASAQKAGDSVTTEALGKGEWIRGTAPAAWEPGKLYMLECWATWCGPCLVTIPHVDALYDKYEPKGLRVIGVNVWEDGRDKVADFVKDKGDGMSYPIVYIGKGGAFETDWLKPAQIPGIPTAFLVKDGKVLITAHPSEISDEMIEGILAGGEAEEKALAKVVAEQKKMAEIGKALQNFRQAAAHKDFDGMSAAIEQIRSGDAASRYLAMMEMELLIARKDWDSLKTRIDGLPEDQRLVALFNLIRPLLQAEDAPADLVKKVATSLDAVLPPGSGPIEYQLVAKLLWKAGDKEGAIAAARKSIEAINKADKADNSLPIAPFQRFLESLQKGEMPTDTEIGGWLRDAMRSTPAN